MKNNKILYLLTIIITLFGFNMNVNAAKELICVYDKVETEVGEGINKDKVLLVQKKSGAIEVSKATSKDANPGDGNWNLLTNTTFNFNDSEYYEEKDSKHILNSCPKSITIKEEKKMEVTESKDTIPGAGSNSTPSVTYKKVNIIDFYNDTTAGVQKINEKEEEKATNLMCIYDINGNKINYVDEKKSKTIAKVILKQDIIGNFSLYTHKSDVSVDTPGWEKSIIKDTKYGDKSAPFKFKTCPGTLKINIEITTTYNTGEGYGTIGSQMDVVKTEEYIIEFYDTETEGGHNLENGDIDPNTRINVDPPPTWEIKPGGSLDNDFEPPESIETITSGKTCEDAIKEYKESNPEEESYLAACYYGEYIEDEGCHIISVSFPTKEQVLVKSIDPSYSFDLYYMSRVAGYGVTDFNPVRQAVIDNDGWCLNRIRVSRSSIRNYINISVDRINDYESYFRIYESGVNIIDGIRPQSDNPNMDDVSLFGDFSFTEFFDCASIFNNESSKKMIEIIKLLVNLVKVAIPILLIGLGVLDFTKAIFTGKEDDMKKVQEKFIKRIIIGVCVFLLPTILKFVLTIGNSVWGDVISADFCGIL